MGTADLSIMEKKMVAKAVSCIEQHQQQPDWMPADIVAIARQQLADKQSLVCVG